MGRLVPIALHTAAVRLGLLCLKAASSQSSSLHCVGRLPASLLCADGVSALLPAPDSSVRGLCHQHLVTDVLMRPFRILPAPLCHCSQLIRQTPRLHEVSGRFQSRREQESIRSKRKSAFRGVVAASRGEGLEALMGLVPQLRKP